MNKYNLVFMSNDTVFNEKWSTFFSQSVFIFYTPPIAGDLIDLSSFLNVKYDKEDQRFIEDFSNSFSAEYVKVIARIHFDNRCFLKVEPNL